MFGSPPRRDGTATEAQRAASGPFRLALLGAALVAERARPLAGRHPPALRGSAMRAASASGGSGCHHSRLANALLIVLGRGRCRRPDPNPPPRRNSVRPPGSRNPDGTGTGYLGRRPIQGLATLVVNKLRGGLKVAAVKAPGCPRRPAQQPGSARRGRAGSGRPGPDGQAPPVAGVQHWCEPPNRAKLSSTSAREAA